MLTSLRTQAATSVLIKIPRAKGAAKYACLQCPFHRRYFRVETRERDERWYLEQGSHREECGQQLSEKSLASGRAHQCAAQEDREIEARRRSRASYSLLSPLPIILSGAYKSMDLVAPRRYVRAQFEAAHTPHSGHGQNGHGISGTL